MIEEIIGNKAVRVVLGTTAGLIVWKKVKKPARSMAIAGTRGMLRVAGVIGAKAADIKKDWEDIVAEAKSEVAHKHEAENKGEEAGDHGKKVSKEAARRIADTMRKSAEKIERLADNLEGSPQ
jgi:uncharacterized protein YjdB